MSETRGYFFLVFYIFFMVTTAFGALGRPGRFEPKLLEPYPGPVRLQHRRGSGRKRGGRAYAL